MATTFAAVIGMLLHEARGGVVEVGVGKQEGEGAEGNLHSASAILLQTIECTLTYIRRKIIKHMDCVIRTTSA